MKISRFSRVYKDITFIPSFSNCIWSYASSSHITLPNICVFQVNNTFKRKLWKTVSYMTQMIHTSFLFFYRKQHVIWCRINLTFLITFQILDLSVCINYSWWKSCLISRVWATPRSEERKVRETFWMKYVTCGILISNPPHRNQTDRPCWLR